VEVRAAALGVDARLLLHAALFLHAALLLGASSGGRGSCSSGVGVERRGVGVVLDVDPGAGTVRSR
jgi:hypothetical protein